MQKHRCIWRVADYPSSTKQARTQTKNVKDSSLKKLNELFWGKWGRPMRVLMPKDLVILAFWALVCLPTAQQGFSNIHVHKHCLEGC